MAVRATKRRIRNNYTTTSKTKTRAGKRRKRKREIEGGEEEICKLDKMYLEQSTTRNTRAVKIAAQFLICITLLVSSK